MLQAAIAKLTQRQDLAEDEMSEVMDHIMSGRATPAQIAGLLVALKMKGESIAEISGAARTMRRHALAVPCRPGSPDDPLLDVVGTGGDGAGTFNVSTVSALVAAGAGVRVAKHGNRAVTSSCGSADLMEALGVELDLGPEELARCIDRVGIGFLFAPNLHRAMRHAVGPRRELGLRSIFNLLGPLTNPAGADCLLVGVYLPELTTPLAEVLGRLGARSALVVHGLDGSDEVSISAPTRVSRLKDGCVREFTITPEKYGLRRAEPEQVSGGSVDQCRRHALAVLSGRPGPRRDMVLLNAAAALVAAGRAAELAEGLGLAAQAIDSGAALAKLEALAAFGRGQEPRAAQA